MLDTHKLLYILPDVAYVAELLPGKKEHTFVVHSFRQINGEFIDDNELIAKNIEKLFSKLTPDTYQLILPDFLFTSTILEVKETSESKVKEYIKNTLLPQLGLTQETHILKPFILNQYGEKSRIQLEALEKSVVASIVQQADQTKSTISNVVPLSWTIKSLVSLEPSISVIQMGSRGYLALHYIGIDQTNDASIQDIDTLAETIKTLRGAEPSIQTVYLLTNDLIEEKLKENLAGVIPVQQLTSANNDSEMPSYVQQVIESGMKSLSIPEYAVPTFPLPKFSEIEAFLAESIESDDNDEDDENEDIDKDSTDASAEKNAEPTKLDEDLTLAAVATSHMDDIPEIGTTSDSENNLPKPSTVLDTATQATSAVSASSLGVSEVGSTVGSAAAPTQIAGTIAPMTELDLSELDPDISDKKEELKVATAQEKELPNIESLPSLKESADEPMSATIPTEQKENVQVLEPVADRKAESQSELTATKIPSKEPVLEPVITPRPVIKNKSNLQPMLKMFFISVSVFFATVAIGVGIGLGFLTLTNNPFSTKTVEETPAPVAATPTPTPTPTPEPVVEIDPSSLSVLVVNATTKAGYAGQIQKTLTSNGFTDVDTRNAKGEYEPGLYILLDEDASDSSSLLKLFSDAAELAFTLGEDKVVEDATKQYDAVVVLAE